MRIGPKSLDIKWRLALTATALTVALIAVVSAMQIHSLRNELGASIASRLSTLTLQTARDLDADLHALEAALTRTAQVLPQAALAGEGEFRRAIEQQQALLTLVDEVVLLAPQGRVLSDYPQKAGRVGIDASDRAYFKQVMRTGKPVISEPLAGKFDRLPFVFIAVPVFDGRNTIVAVLSGLLRLDRPNLFGRLAGARVGESGYYFVLSRLPDPVYVVHPDAQRILKPRPADGAASTARALLGFEGTTEDIDDDGTRALFSYQTMRTTGWTLATALPTAEAFAPLVAAERRAIVNALIAALCVAPLMWFFAWKALSPLLRLSASIRAMRADGGRLAAVEVGRHDEIGKLARSFNALVGELEGTQSRLRDSERRMRSITDSLPALVCYIDSGHVFRFNNLAYERWLQKPLTEITGRTVAEVYGDEVYQHLLPAIDAALRGERSRFEVAFTARDGTLHHASGKYLPHRSDDGSIVGIHGLIIDETKQRRATVDLETSRRFVQRTGEVAGVGGWQFELASNTLTWSEVTCRLHDVPTDYRPELDAAIGFYAPSAQPLIRAAVEAALANGTAWDLELPLVTATGRPFWARVNGAAEYEDGKPARLIGAIQDITARKQIEQALQDSREMLQVTLDSIGDAVITTDNEGRVLWLNPVAERMTGWLKAEATGRPLRQVFVTLDDETRRPAADPVHACIESGRTTGLARNTLLISRDGVEYGIEDSAAPIRASDGASHGAVLVFRDVSEQRRLSREMSHRATHDSLTGLVNRSEFETRLGRVFDALTNENGNNALLYIDLDQFKLVNDACGHSVGDQLLRQVSSLIAGTVRSRDTVARLGGDEFGVILERCDLERAQKVAQKICDQMEDFRFLHDGRRFRVGASIGLVPVDRRWINMAAVLQAADSSCYAAKEAGRNRVHVWFDTDRVVKARQGEMQWVGRLEQALDEDRFELYSQRIEQLAGATVGMHCEVLLRLREPDGTIVAPGVFLPAAERFNMATRIDRWVLRRIIGWLDRARIEGRAIALVSVNLSGHSVGDRAFHRDAREMLRLAAFDLRQLCFEITETAAITNFSDAKAFIDEMRALGVRIALDDFGAGASSFGYLKTLPVDYLKIDGQFITDLLTDELDHAAVRCFNEVATIVGVKTIAECVETEEIRLALTDIGIDMVQGYLIHRPEPMERFDALEEVADDAAR